MRNRGDRRHQDWRKARRKRRIYRELICPLFGVWDAYDNLHEYSKGHMFCGCPLCRRKTNNKGKHRNRMPSKNWPVRDLKRLDEMSEQISEEEDLDG